MKRWTLLLTCFCISMGLAIAQNVTVKGKVVEENGDPIIGASVVVKGETTIGTITDLNGEFSLRVPDSARYLIVKYLGMEDQEVAVAPFVSVTMSASATDLDEVIIVAYGTAKKSAFTGAAASLKAEKLTTRSVSDITNSLSGQLAGVQVANLNGGQPGEAATIRVRGFGSMNSANGPLYIVDGVPFDGSLSSINPNDIESLTVLKDAAANAIYGARGANGVVLITTKKGGQKAVVSVDAKWGANSRAVPNYDVITEPGLYYETYYKSLYNSRAYNNYTQAEAHDYANRMLYSREGLGYLVYTIPEGERLIGTNFKLNPNATLGYSDGEYYYTPDNWYDEMFKKNNLRQEYNVSISGSADKLNYYLSIGYLDDTGIIPNSGFQRYTGRLNADYKAKDWLQVGASVAYTYYDQQAPTDQTEWASAGNVFYLANMVAPIYPLYVRTPDRYVKKDFRGYTVYDFGASSTNFTRPFMNMGSPGNVILDKYNSYNDVINSKVFANIYPVEGLRLTASLGLNVFNERSSILQNAFYGSAVGSGGFATVNHERDFAVNQQFLANYARTLNDVHSFELLAGYESYDRKIQYLNGSVDHLYDPFVPELGNGIPRAGGAGSYSDHYVTKGFLSRIQYEYDGKYFLSGSYRRDASSRFHPDNRWGDFGSAGFAWLMNKESFLEEQNSIDLLKLKVSYGIQGNDDIGNYYAYLDQYEIQDGKPVLYYKGNPDITWETSYAFNVGVDFELFKNRISGTIEYFNRKTDNQLYLKPVPLSVGYAREPHNIGSVRNDGMEIDLNGILYKNKNITWSLNVNATHVRNKILALAPELEAAGGQKFSNKIFKVGGSVYNFYMPKGAGVNPETGEYMYYIDPDNGNYETTTDYSLAHQADLGGSLPDVYGGFGTTVNAYGFDLSIQFSYQLGGRIYDGSYAELMHTGYAQTAGQGWHRDILDSWTPENKGSSVPRLSSSDDCVQIQSSRFIVSSDYLSLNNVVLGYTFPKAMMQKFQIGSLRIYVSGDNLALFSTRKGLDPRTEWGLGSATTSGNFRYSILRTLSGGINITF
ncbi:TonB-dependent receptor [Bacteroidales bacterium OttesenSCG-928-M06]|nr:TonB-dependent receptor [Bacteroidales bacterium OttesenSCG-928-M06]